LLLALVGVLLFAGSEKWIEFSIVGKSAELDPEAGFAISLQSAILAFCVSIVSVIALWSLIMWMWRLPNRMKTGIGRKRETNGLDAVEEALIAGEAGDGDRARKKAQKASDLLKRPALTELVAAKAAEASGASDQAATHYTTLLDDPKTEAAGRRGLARLAEASGDHGSAIDMAKAAYEPPKGPLWAFDLLFNAQLANNDWPGALETLAIGEKRKHIDKDPSRRRRAVLLVAQAAKHESDGDKNAAVESVLKASDASPGFAPGAALAARLLTQNEQSKKAASLIEKAWSRAPHPALALAYRDIFKNEPKKVLAKKIKSLVKANPGHRESAILTAEHALTEQDGVAALTALGGLLRGEDPSARLCALAAAAEEKLGNAVDARAWQLRAATAPLEADWSDLDPDGPGFNYTNRDWRRLVQTYGEAGDLVHPRYEAGKRRRAVVAPEHGPADTPASTGSDDPIVTINEGDAKDIADRLNNLMDDPQAP
jgi:HemY protein